MCRFALIFSVNLKDEIVSFQNPTRIFTHIVCSMRKIAGILKNPKNSRRECAALPSNFLLSEHSLFSLEAQGKLQQICKKSFPVSQLKGKYR